MVQVPWGADVSKPDFDSLPPGRYLVEVKESEERRGRKGPYFNVRLHAVKHGKHLCYDILSFSDRAWWMTRNKLEALGFSESDANLEPHQLVGRRAYVEVGIEEYTDENNNTRSSIKVDIRAEGSKSGYWPESAPPEGVSEPTQASPPEDSLDVPF